MSSQDLGWADEAEARMHRGVWFSDLREEQSMQNEKKKALIWSSRIFSQHESRLGASSGRTALMCYVATVLHQLNRLKVLL